MPPDPCVLLEDVERAGAEIERFTEGIDGDAYARDPLMQAAVERKFEIIGEALNRLGKSHADLVERIPRYRMIIDFRKTLIDGYASVMSERVWDRAENHLPEPFRIVQLMLAKMGSPEG